MSLQQLSIDINGKFALVIYSDFRALSSECRTTDEFINAQHQLNMAGVSQRWQKT